MTYTLPSNNITNNSEALLDLVTYTSGQVPILIPSILLLIFIVILGSGYFSEERRRGKGSFAKWFSISGFITATLSIIMYLMGGLINISTVVITIIISLVGTLWLIFTGVE